MQSSDHEALHSLFRLARNSTRSKKTHALLDQIENLVGNIVNELQTSNEIKDAKIERLKDEHEDELARADDRVCEISDGYADEISELEDKHADEVADVCEKLESALEDRDKLLKQVGLTDLQWSMRGGKCYADFED